MGIHVDGVMRLQSESYEILRNVENEKIAEEEPDGKSQTWHVVAFFTLLTSFVFSVPVLADQWLFYRGLYNTILIIILGYTSKMNFLKR